MMRLINYYQNIVKQSRNWDFIALLLIRLYLIPIFWMAGMNKLQAFDSTVNWFGNSDWGLGLPFPTLLTVLAIGTELGGAILLTLGLWVRLISIPLMITMTVAAVTTHLHNGWLAIADASGPFATERTMEAAERLARIKSILKEHGNYEWLTEQGSIVILNNGIEFSATYFVMLFVLFFYGAGKFISLDYWLSIAINNKTTIERDDQFKF